MHETKYPHHLELALRLCNELKLEEAESLLLGIIGDGSNCVDAYSCLALVFFLQGRAEAQSDLLLKALQIDSSHYLTLHQAAYLQLRGAQFDKSLHYCRRALTQNPDSIETLTIAAKASYHAGDFKAAMAYAEQILAVRGRWDPVAIEIKAQAMIANSSTQDLTQQLFASLKNGSQDLGKLSAIVALTSNWEESRQLLRLTSEALDLYPDSRVLRLLRVGILRKFDKLDECFVDLYFLLSLDAADLVVLHQFGEIYIALKCYHQAAEVYLRIARLSGSTAQVLNQIGVCYRELVRLNSASKAFRRSIAKNAVNAASVSNLGEIEFRAGNYDAAKKLYTIALNIDPHCQVAFSNLMLTYSVCDADQISKMLSIAQTYWAKRNTVEPSPALVPPSTRSPPVDRQQEAARGIPPAMAQATKLRIGILTSDIGNHCVSYFLASFLKHYDRQRFVVELILCDRRYEERELLICGWADHAFSVVAVNEDVARHAIRKRNYDVVIECNGYTGNSGISILRGRCAPIQCHYIGYHGSLGLDTIDYFISDNYILSDEVATRLSEKPLRLNRAWLAFHLFEEPPIATSVVTAEQPVFGFFGNSAKITSRTLEFWAAIMQACENALLVLKCLSYQDSSMAEKIIERIQRFGIAKDRILLLNSSPTWRNHMESYNLIDYALDSTPWSSATTGFDCLAMGVPILSIAGNTIASRMSSSLVFHLGHPEWIATTPEDYSRFGCMISADYMHVRNNKQELQKEVLRSSLFDSESLAHALETTLLSLHQSASLFH